ncbi:uncharacterized protein LOC129569669 [Sitodiplosis mosellana]|uniref:uncharacterized protein LOC129569669 n=1 Tax=Sitodiplosis mosellana TaxID=263140 RepID=UPI002443E133|nr:uncharacterized protein LOC129569669 [Sitodiplosis mosellana]
MSVKSMTSAVFLLILCIISQTRCDLSRVYLPTAEFHQPEKNYLSSYQPAEPPTLSPFKFDFVKPQPVSVPQNPFLNQFTTTQFKQQDSFPAPFEPVKLPEFTTFKPFATTSKPLQISYNPPHPFPTLKPLAPVYKPQPLQFNNQFIPTQSPAFPNYKAPSFPTLAPLKQQPIYKAPSFPQHVYKQPIYETPSFPTFAPLKQQPIYKAPSYPTLPPLKPLAPVYKPQPLAPLSPVPSLPFNPPIQHDFPIQPTLTPLSPKPNFNIPPPEQLPQGPELDNYLSDLFHDFVRQYKREYISEPIEMAYRFDVFKGNFFTMQEHTKSDRSSADYSITEFADLTNTEFERVLGWDESLSNTTGIIENADIPSDAQGRSAGGVEGEIPEHYDQREENLVTRVKNQGDCACCWAFVTTAVIEGLCAKRIKQLQEFSEQSLLDCDKSNYGCKGGVPENAVKHIEKRGGLELETVYPYEYAQSTCRFEKRNVRVKVDEPVKFKKNDEEGMKRWLYTNGPIAVALNAAPLKYYKGGVLNPTSQLCSPKQINHAVTIIGYGVEKNTTGEKLPYWIVKNSWATGWGENGNFLFLVLIEE